LDKLFYLSTRTHCYEDSLEMIRCPTSSALYMMPASFCFKPAMQPHVVALVLTHLDYGNATLAGLTDQSLVRLQSVLNAAARLIFKSRKIDHVTPERIAYKLAVLIFKRRRISPANSIVWLTRTVDSSGWLGFESGSHHNTSPSSYHRLSRSHGRGWSCKEHSSMKHDLIVEFGCSQVSLRNLVVHAMLWC